MAIQKYGDAEQADVFHGREAQVVNVHMQRHGKAVSEFSQEQKATLDAELEQLRAEDNANKDSVEQSPVREDAPETGRESKRSSAGRQAKKTDE